MQIARRRESVYVRVCTIFGLKIFKLNTLQCSLILHFQEIAIFCWCFRCMMPLLCLCCCCFWCCWFCLSQAIIIIPLPVCVFNALHILTRVRERISYAHLVYTERERENGSLCMPPFRIIYHTKCINAYRTLKRLYRHRMIMDVLAVCK